MKEFLEATGVEQVPMGAGITVTVAGKVIAIFNVNGDLYAIGDTCVHAGASLGPGKLNGKIVTCPAHGLRYDVTTGEVTTGGLSVGSYPVRVEDGKVLVAVD